MTDTHTSRIAGTVRPCGGHSGFHPRCDLCRARVYAEERERTRAWRRSQEQRRFWREAQAYWGVYGLLDPGIVGEDSGILGDQWQRRGIDLTTTTWAAIMDTQELT